VSKSVKRPFQGLLRTVFFSGLILSFLISVPLAVFSVLSVIRSAPQKEGAGAPADPWAKSRWEFDALMAGNADPDQLDRTIGHIEKKAEGIEARLSVLKRRRELSKRAPRFTGNYRNAALKAADAFPYSQPLAALAAAALIRNAPITGALTEELEKRTALLRDASFSPLVLGIRILMGDLHDPGKARASSRLESLFSAAFPLVLDSMPADEAEELVTDFAILDILAGDTQGAASRIINAGTEEHTPDFLRFAAEYYYDFGDPLRAAGMFSRLEGEDALIREADALWLAGYREAAENIWKIIVSPAAPDGADSPTPADPSLPSERGMENASSDDAVFRSLYNLAGGADGKEAAAWLERLWLYTAGGTGGRIMDGDTVRFGIIRYTRLLPGSSALAVLEDPALRAYPLLDLELLRRREDFWGPDRITGETWLLLGRHPDARELYRWAAWYFNLQRKYDETSRLVETAESRGIREPWLLLHQGIYLLAEGNLDRAEEALRSVPEDAAWQSAANLGLIMEARRSPQAAISFYETAAAVMEKSAVEPPAPGAFPKEAARLQLRIAGCFRILGRGEESRRVLEYARDLDPENITVQMELRNIESAAPPQAGY
jgi:tetratricopeptide (TPR) repeat protein